MTDTDIDVLAPDASVKLSDGSEITAREFSFFEGLKVAHEARDFIADLKGVFSRQSGGEDFTIDLLDCFGRHLVVVMEMLQLSTGRDRDWLMALNQDDGQRVLLAFWEANKNFFGPRVMRVSPAPDAPQV